jgi:tetratricopeptide (TPR) repeat protein
MNKHRKIVITIGIAACVAALAAGCGPKPEPAPEVPPTPTEPTVLERIELARVYMDEGRVGDAAEHYRRILEIDPRNFDANLNLGIALMTMEDAEFVNQRDYTEIKQYFRTAAGLGTGDARPYIYLGTIDFKAGNHSGAIDRLAVAKSLAPNSESVHEMLGVSLVMTGSVETGKQELRRTLEINPYNEVANLELGNLYEKEDKNEPAMRHLERALDANPNLDMAIYVLERVYYEEGFYDRAEETCRRFLRFHPDDIQSLEILGWIYKRQEHTQEMIETYTELARLEPDNTGYWSPLIQHYMENNDYQRARDVLEECLGQNPYYAYGNVRYGQVLIHYGDESLGNGSRQEALRLFSLARDYLEKAKVDDRYSAAASQLIDQAESRIRQASSR